MSQRISSRRFLCVALLLGMSECSTVTAQSPLNTLFIVADDVGVDAIGCYGRGASPPPTPNIDALAARGVRFTNAQSCPLCSPTRASMLTGRHGFRTGVGTALGTSAPGLAPTEVLLPELLNPVGVRTALIGKWHLGDDQGALTPTAEGFAEFIGTVQGEIPNYFRWPKATNGQITIETNYATTELVDEALAFVQRQTGPWCLVLTFHAAHTPLHAPPSNLHTQGLAGLDPGTSPIPFFKAMVQAMDTEIGRLLANIPAATLAQTNIAFLGDNGSSRETVQPPFDPNRAKGTIYQGGVQVPLIFAGPAVGGAPRVEPALAHAVDLFVTLAAFHGVDARATIPATTRLDGVDLRSVLAAPDQTARAYSYTQAFAGNTAMSQSGDTESMRNARYKLLRFRQAGGSEREEMYDLANDPFENVDLLAQPLAPAAARAYRQIWRELAILRGYPSAIAFGRDCTGGGVTPTLRAMNAPILGSTFDMQVQGLSGAVTAVLGCLGTSDQTYGGLPLPLDLSALGMLGCALQASLDVNLNLPIQGGSAPWPIAVPNDANLLGGTVFGQAVTLVPGANPAQLLVTRALQIVLGG
jgi:arylsulfatase B